MTPALLADDPAATRCAAANRPPPDPGLRAGFAYLGLVGYFLAAPLIPLADITALMLTQPVMASTAAIMIRGEIHRLRRWLAIAIGLVGALIVVRPGFAGLNPGVLLAIWAVVMMSGSPPVSPLRAVPGPDPGPSHEVGLDR